MAERQPLVEQRLVDLQYRLARGQDRPLEDALQLAQVAGPAVARAGARDSSERRSTTAPARRACWPTKKRASSGTSSARSASDGTRTAPARAPRAAAAEGRVDSSGAEVHAMTRTSGTGVRAPPRPRAPRPRAARRAAPAARAAAGGSPRGKSVPRSASSSGPSRGGSGGAGCPRPGRQQPCASAGEESAVDVDERLAAPRRLVVDRARDRLVPGPERPGQEQRLAEAASLRDRLAQGAHGRARAEERALDPPARVGQQLLRHLQLARELGVAALELGRSRWTVRCVWTRATTSSGWNGFVTKSTAPASSPRTFSRRLRESGEEDDGGAARLRVGLQPAARLVAVDAGHDHVEEDERGAGAVRDLERVLAAGGDEQAVAPPVERLAQEVEVRRLVVHEQDARRLFVGAAAVAEVGGRHARSIVDRRRPACAGDGKGARSMEQMRRRGPRTGHRTRGPGRRRRHGRGRLDGGSPGAARRPRTRLRSTLRSMVQTLDLWAADQVRGVKAVAAEPRVREAVGGLVAGRAAEVESWVKVASAIRGYGGYLIIDSEWRVVASDRPEVVGLPRTSPPTRSSPAACGRRARPSRGRCRPSGPASTPRASSGSAPRPSSCAPGLRSPGARAAPCASASTP